jgi:hypothetical protein
VTIASARDIGEIESQPIVPTTNKTELFSFQTVHICSRIFSGTMETVAGYNGVERRLFLQLLGQLGFTLILSSFVQRAEATSLKYKIEEARINENN